MSRSAHMLTTCPALRVADSALPGALWLSPLQLCSEILMLLRKSAASCFSLPFLHKITHQARLRLSDFPLG